MQNNLKPCPFCGGQVRILHDADGTPSGVHCKCGALVRFLFIPKVVGENFGAVQERIMERWNKRAEVTDIDVGNIDLISRQDALDILEDFESCVYKATGRAYEEARKAICELQSQPETHDKRTETHSCDCISRQDAIQTALDFIVEYLGGAFDEDFQRKLIERMNALPPAQPEIIRCKDCKFYSPMNRETKTGICSLTMHQNFGDNWFCAGAERRTNGSD